MMQLILVLSISIKLLNLLARPLRNRVLVNVDKIKVKVNNFFMRLVIISLKGCLKKLTKLSRSLAMFLFLNSIKHLKS